MNKIVVVCAGFALALAAGMAHATKPGNNGGGNGGCGVGQTTNGCGGGSTPNTAHGGAGGNGVGVGVGVGIGIGQGGNANATGGKGGDGGSVIGSGNSSNLNNNANSNKQGQAQGQKQGQQQGQAQSSKNSNRNDNKSSATGGNSSASNSNSNANSGNNSDQSVTVQGDSYEASRIPVATAYAPNIAPTAVCMGSTSAGGQGMTFGVSFGTSWTDDNCMLLEQVRTVAVVIGDKAIAAEMMCDVPAYASARERAGQPCGKTQAVAQAAPTTATAATTSTAPRNSRYEGNDPIVRARLGLPPLKQ